MTLRSETLKKLTSLLAVLLLGLGTVALPACGGGGNDMDEAMEEVEDEVDDAADEIEDEVDDQM